MVTTQDDDPFRRSYQYPRTKALKLSILGANIYVAVFQYRNKTQGKGWKTSSYNPFLMLHMNIFSGINIFQTISRTFFDSRHWGFVVVYFHTAHSPFLMDSTFGRCPKQFDLKENPCYSRWIRSSSRKYLARQLASGGGSSNFKYGNGQFRNWFVVGAYHIFLAHIAYIFLAYVWEPPEIWLYMSLYCILQFRYLE